MPPYCTSHTQQPSLLTRSIVGFGMLHVLDVDVSLPKVIRKLLLTIRAATAVSRLTNRFNTLCDVKPIAIVHCVSRDVARSRRSLWRRFHQSSSLQDSQHCSWLLLSPSVCSSCSVAEKCSCNAHLHTTVPPQVQPAQAQWLTGCKRLSRSWFLSLRAIHRRPD